MELPKKRIPKKATKTAKRALKFASGNGKSETLEPLFSNLDAPTTEDPATESLVPSTSAGTVILRFGIILRDLVLGYLKYNFMHPV